MAETLYGPGGYGRTSAGTPSAPLLTDVSSCGVIIGIGPDENPEWTQYAIVNVTDGCYASSDGSKSETEVWQTRSEWGETALTGLEQDTNYSFCVKAHNMEGIETPKGEQSSIRTYNSGETQTGLGFTVEKASSTVVAPDFMTGLAPSIKIGGKELNDLGFHTDRISGLDMPRILSDEELVPGGHTWIVRDEYFSIKRIVIEGYVHGTSPDDLRMRLSYLKSFLATFGGDPWRSTSPVRLERTDIPERHWIVYYDSMEEIEFLGKRELSSSMRVRITMKCAEPFARSNETVRVIFEPSEGSFRCIDLGNAPSDAVYVIKGGALSPYFSVGDMVFLTDFAERLAFTDVMNDTGYGVFSPPEEGPGAYVTTDTGMGISITNGNTLCYTATGNRDDCSWLLIFEPDWQSSDRETDAVIFEHRGDADNYLRVYWDALRDVWVFKKRAEGIDAEAITGTQAFTAGTKIVLGITFDSTNAGGMKIFVNGVPGGANDDIEQLAVVPNVVSLHAGDGTLQPDAVFDMVAGWSRMLSSDEMLKVSTEPESVKNLNKKVYYDGELDEGDLLMLDSRHKTAVLFDVSEDANVNVLDNTVGMVPLLIPGRKRTATDHTQTMIFCGTGMARMEVRYRRRYL